jgi:hypothetical protein
MQIEVVERRRVVAGRYKNLWEVRVDHKTVEIFEFDPTKIIQDMCKNLEAEGAKITEQSEYRPEFEK